MYKNHSDNEYEDPGYENSVIHISIEILEYSEENAAKKTVIKKYNSSVCTMSFDSQEYLNKRTLPVDNFIQVVAGTVEIVIDGTSNMLDLGQGIIVPAHSSYYLNAVSYFKMITTMVHDSCDQ